MLRHIENLIISSLVILAISTCKDRDASSLASSGTAFAGSGNEGAIAYADIRIMSPMTIEGVVSSNITDGSEDKFHHRQQVRLVFNYEGIAPNFGHAVGGAPDASGVPSISFYDIIGSGPLQGGGTEGTIEYFWGPSYSQQEGATQTSTLRIMSTDERTNISKVAATITVLATSKRRPDGGVTPILSQLKVQ